MFYGCSCDDEAVEGLVFYFLPCCIESFEVVLRDGFRGVCCGCEEYEFYGEVGVAEDACYLCFCLDFFGHEVEEGDSYTWLMFV